MEVIPNPAGQAPFGPVRMRASTVTSTKVKAAKTGRKRMTKRSNLIHLPYLRSLQSLSDIVDGQMAAAALGTAGQRATTKCVGNIGEVSGRNERPDNSDTAKTSGAADSRYLDNYSENVVEPEHLLVASYAP